MDNNGVGSVTEGKAWGDAWKPLGYVLSEETPMSLLVCGDEDVVTGMTPCCSYGEVVFNVARG